MSLSNLLVYVDNNVINADSFEGRNATIEELDAIKATQLDEIIGYLIDEGKLDVNELIDWLRSRAQL